MLKWDDTGIVVSVSRYGEQSAIVRVLTEHHGLCPGMVRGAYSKQGRGVYQPGNLLHVQWQARLVEQLGTLRGELLYSGMAQLLAEPQVLRLLNTALAMVLLCVPERIDEREIFLRLKSLFSEFDDADEARMLQAYVWLEFALLNELGFGLDLTECAATGECPPENLVYVSPRSGKAVSREAGAPYHAKLLPLPAFLRDGKSTADMRQILDGLALTGYFLESRLLAPEGKRLPVVRGELLREMHEKHHA